MTYPFDFGHAITLLAMAEREERRQFTKACLRDENPDLPAWLQLGSNFLHDLRAQLPCLLCKQTGILKEPIYVSQMLDPVAYSDSICWHCHGTGVNLDLISSAINVTREER